MTMSGVACTLTRGYATSTPDNSPVKHSASNSPTTDVEALASPCRAAADPPAARALPVDPCRDPAADPPARAPPYARSSSMPGPMVDGVAPGSTTPPEKTNG